MIRVRTFALSASCLVGALHCGDAVRFTADPPGSTTNDQNPDASVPTAMPTGPTFESPDTPSVPPDAGCTGPDCDPAARCGDGALDPGEDCDDGNPIPGDGCSGTCLVEPNFACEEPGEQCVSTIVCGDGDLDPSEACDDDNDDAGDGCDESCQVEAGFGCGPAGDTCVPVDTSGCGDGMVNAGETCDDGQAPPESGDGCSNTCQVEGGFTCSLPGAACVRDEFCGDGVLNGTEECDDTNQDPGDGCTGICTVEPFFTCPVEGDPCESLIVCGDGEVIGDEACDDDNDVAGDGCAADCKSVEPGFTCPRIQGVGGPCQPLPPASCGDAILTFGEACDDGSNTDPNDGCTADCTVLPGFTCPAVGMACAPIAFCGDGVWDSLREGCDNGAACTDGSDCTDDPDVCAGIGDETCLPRGGDGCSTTCIVEADFACPDGVNCVSTVVCGDGLVRGNETCDDGPMSGPGCNLCQLVPGYVCPPGAACRAAACGDGIRAGFEECDDGNSADIDGCSALCRLEEGFMCEALGDPDGDTCTPTDCGDSSVEGTERCDDGNTDSGDGCTPECQLEPTCADPATGIRRACTSICGDGIKFPAEDCDDGNLRDGDGCSSSCLIEPGYTCSVPPQPSVLNLPVTYRDFAAGTTAAGPPDVGHPDMEWPSGLFAVAGLRLGLARATLGNLADGSELLGKPIFTYQGNVACPLAPGALVRGGVSYCVGTVRDADSFQSWYSDTGLEQATEVTTLPLLLTGANSYVFDSNTDLPDGFFPLDDLGTTGNDGDGTPHNFHFTSEVRYYFEHTQGAGATLLFRGDDDVFVFINGNRVIDIGGVHEAIEASINVDTLGLTSGSIYEIVVFQAERNQTASNYRLELRNFLLQRSECLPMCGDGIVTRDEACDLGEDANGVSLNTGAYGTCNSDCTLPAFCGDGTPQVPPEQCDDGTNLTLYGGTSATACGPGCMIAPYCGDEVIDGARGEACDDGADNQPPATAYNSCRTDCQLGPRCGDGIGQPGNGEECDDGILNGTSGSGCQIDCQANCGNGTLDPGEQCDAGAADNIGGYEGCNVDCTLGPFCGDGIPQAGSGEQCDDGLNDGSFGTCAPGCVLGPRCGDSVVQSAAGEVCDLGAANNASAYGPGLCRTNCRPAPFCGDRAVNVAQGEVCDDGINNGAAGSCSPDCTARIPLPECGDGMLDPGETCDLGPNNGSAASGCDTGCRTRCGNGVIESGEACDNGVNDGSYGTCNNDCTIADFCGDGDANGPEQCDEGAANQSNPYGEDLCTLGCMDAPYCGDGRIQTGFGEECDSTPGCDANCEFSVVIQ